MTGEWKDLIDEYMERTEGISSPRLFRLWSAISMVAGALERRVWAVSKNERIFPSLFVLLVGKPGSGKSQAIRVTSAAWYATKELKVAPQSVTKASLTDELEQAKRVLVTKEGGEIIEYHSLQIAASEFGVLVPAHDLEFLNFLNQIYDNDPNYRETRRTGNRKVDIINPQINLLAGTQPAYLATLLPEEAWGMGFMTRMVMVYSGEKIDSRLFDSHGDKEHDFTSIVNKLKQLLKIHGRADWDEDTKRAIQGWWDLDGPPIPEHSRLAAYNSRRILHLIRLCLVSAAAAGHPLRITLDDFTRATDWLIAAEQTMPDIFKEMVHKSDAQVIQELHMFVWQIYARDKKPVHEARLIHFLQTRAPADKIDRLLQVAVRANIFDKIEPHFYKPRPRSDHGVE